MNRIKRKLEVKSEYYEHVNYEKEDERELKYKAMAGYDRGG
jgi:hypothetical protein